MPKTSTNAPHHDDMTPKQSSTEPKNRFMVSFGVPAEEEEEEEETMKQQHAHTKSCTEDLENPTSLGGETEIIEEEDESTIVQENPDSKYSSSLGNSKCCGFWIVSFVLIMIFSRQLVHSVF